MMGNCVSSICQPASAMATHRSPRWATAGHAGKEHAIFGNATCDQSDPAAPSRTPANIFLTNGTGLQSLPYGSFSGRAERRLMRAWCTTSVLTLLGGVLWPSTVSGVIGIAWSVRFLRRVSQPISARDVAAGVQVQHSWILPACNFLLKHLRTCKYLINVRNTPNVSRLQVSSRDIHV